MENISVTLNKNENQTPFRQGLAISSLELLDEIEGDVIQMARAFVANDAPYLDNSNVFVKFHTNEHQALMSVEFGVYGALDLDVFGKAFSRFAALKKTSAQILIFEELSLVKNQAAKIFSPIMTIMIDDEELMAAGVKNPELYRSQLVDTIKASYSFMLSRLEQKAFDMINVKIK